MEIPNDYTFSKTHEWVKFLDDGSVLTGLANFAQKALSDLVFLDAPGEGDSVTVGEPYADIESVKAVSPIYSHVTGTIIEVNEDVADNPGKINEDPYGSWIIKIGDVSEKGDLMDAAEYEIYEKSCCSEDE
jgi:glycine cleavage system H protein